MTIVKTPEKLPRSSTFENIIAVASTLRDMLRFLDSLPKFEVLESEFYLPASTNTTITLRTELKKVIGLLQVQLYRSKDPATILDTGIRVALPHWRWHVDGLRITYEGGASTDGLHKGFYLVIGE